MTTATQDRLVQRDKHAGTEQYRAMLSRMIRAFGKRVRSGHADLDSLTQLQEIQAELTDQMGQVVASLRSAEGGAYSWAQIGDALGITRQAAQQRFGAYVTDAARRPGGQPAEMR